MHYKKGYGVDILYLLIPLSLLIVFAIAWVFWWALSHRQFDDLEDQGQRILDDHDTPK
jgi:cbb3-type cytochrome oxidase maturation protein